MSIIVSTIMQRDALRAEWAKKLAVVAVRTKQRLAVCGAKVMQDLLAVHIVVQMTIFHFGLCKFQQIDESIAVSNSMVVRLSLKSMLQRHPRQRFLFTEI